MACFSLSADSASMSTSMSTSGCSLFVLKGARIDLGIEEPPHITVRGGRDPLEGGEPGAVETLLELDQVRAVHPAPLAECVMGEAEGLPGALHAGRDQRQRGVAQEDLEVCGNRQRSATILRS